MKALKLLIFTLLVFVAATAFIDTAVVELNNMDKPKNSVRFDSPRFDEAREIYRSMRDLPTGHVIIPNDLEAWKEFEKFKIDSHWDEIVSGTAEAGFETVGVYFNTDRNRWMPTIIDDAGNTVNLYPDCSGMGCEYGCCEICFAFNISGSICYPICCDCEDYKDDE